MYISKATTVEKAEYQQTQPIYPLSHWLTLDSGHRCPMEYLNEQGGPKYEVMAPDGFHFAEGHESDCVDSLHSLLAITLADAQSRCERMVLKPCTLSGNP